MEIVPLIKKRQRSSFEKREEERCQMEQRRREEDRVHKLQMLQLMLIQNFPVVGNFEFHIDNDPGVEGKKAPGSSYCCCFWTTEPQGSCRKVRCSKEHNLVI